MPQTRQTPVEAPALTPSPKLLQDPWAAPRPPRGKGKLCWHALLTWVAALHAGSPFKARELSEKIWGWFGEPVHSRGVAYHLEVFVNRGLLQRRLTRGKTQLYVYYYLPPVLEAREELGRLEEPAPARGGFAAA